MNQCNLRLNLSKCELFSWSGELPANTPPGMTLAGVEVDGKWENGCLVYGVPVGTDAYVAAMLDSKVEEIARKATRTCEVLEGEAQALWAVLRLSIQQKFGYWLALVHPSQARAAAARWTPGWTGC